MGIEVGFDIDANGIVDVSAVDKSTGKKQSITIRSSGGLSDAEIEKMVQQAEDMRDADTKKKELVTVRNDAETLAYQVEKQTTELKDKMSTADADELKAKVADIRQYMASDDVDPQELKRKTTELQEKSWNLPKRRISRVRQKMAQQEMVGVSRLVRVKKKRSDSCERNYT